MPANMLAQFLQYWRRLQTPKIVVRMRGEGMIVEEARSYCTDFQLALEGVAIEKKQTCADSKFYLCATQPEGGGVSDGF